MYERYFGFSQLPFSAAPDPRFLFMSEQHREALAHLLYGIDHGGIVLLTGDVGAGKTTMCRCLLEKLPEHVDVAFIFNPKLTGDELLATICDEFHIAVDPTRLCTKYLIDELNRYLLDAHARGRTSVLIIDEAQNLGAPVLEQMRLLTNLETNERKLLHIVMAGQNELAEILAKPGLRQLAQRITTRHHLGPLSEGEVAGYVAHRLRVAGVEAALFTRPSLRCLHRLSKGIPRVVNALCDRALLGAYVERRDRVQPATIRKAAREVLGGALTTRRHLPVAAAGAAAAAMLVAFGIVVGHATGSGEAGPWPWLRRAVDAVMHLRSPAAEAAVDPGTAAETTGNDATVATTGPPLILPQSEFRSQAFATLFEQWGLPAPEAGVEPCAAAAVHGLRCAQGYATVERLRSLNRPGVLMFVDDQGVAYYGTITSLGATSATVSIAGRAVAMTLRELEGRWMNQFVMLWRAPPGDARKLTVGDRGPAVQWVDERLARLNGAAGPTLDVFDEGMQYRVKQFQAQKGLKQDGIVGPQTMLQLAAADGEGPSLAGLSSAR